MIILRIFKESYDKKICERTPAYFIAVAYSCSNFCQFIWKTLVAVAIHSFLMGQHTYLWQLKTIVFLYRRLTVLL